MFEMKHCASAGLLTEVNEGNEELAGASFPSLASVASRAVGRFLPCGAPGSPRPDISNQAVEATATRSLVSLNETGVRCGVSGRRASPQRSAEGPCYLSIPNPVAGTL